MTSESVSAKIVGAIFQETALLLELKGENQFRVRAYESAARLLLSQTMSAAELLVEVEAGRIRGIGAGLQEALREISATGDYALLAELRLSFPPGLLQLLRIPGLGPKKLKILHEELGIGDIESLIRACDSGRLLELRGFSEKTRVKIKESAMTVIGNSARMRLPEALRIIEETGAGVGSAGSCSPAGGVRRSVPVVDELHMFAVESGNTTFLDERLTVAAAGESPRTITLTTSPPDIAGSMHLFTTGSEAHVRRLQDLAESRGLTLTATGLFRATTRLDSATESAIYSALKLAFIPPELRETGSEVDTAGELFASTLR